MAEPGVYVVFELTALVNAVKSKEAGREVCDEIPHVRIRNAGEDKHEFFGPVNEQIIARFPQEWDAFQRGTRVAESGTPVDRWPQLSPGQVRTLKGLNFYTVEDVATATDAAIQRYGMGGQKLRTDAQKFLSLAQSAADVAQLDDLKDAVKALTEANRTKDEQLDTMQRMLEKLSKVEQPAPPEAGEPPARRVKAKAE